MSYFWLKEQEQEDKNLSAELDPAWGLEHICAQVCESRLIAAPAAAVCCVKQRGSRSFI